MKNSFLIILSIILLWACSEKSDKSVNDEYHFQQFSHEELKQDLNYLFNKLDTTHYNLYHKHSKMEFEDTYHELMNGIQDSMNLFEFYYHVLPLYNMLEDAHSSLLFPFDYTDEYENMGGKFIPLEVEIENEHIYIKKNYSTQDIDLYSEIISINDISNEQIIDNLEILINNERKTSEDKYMARFFDRVLFPLYCFDKHYTITILSPDNVIKTVELTGVAANVFQRKRESFYSYYSIGDSIGVIDLNLCEASDKFASFCDSVFTILQTENIPNLIIDVRDNGGGSTFHGDTLFTYITDKAFTQYGSVKVKLSPMVNSESDSIFIENYNGQTEHSYYNPKRFKGDIYMITNQNSFSSATMMAATFKCYNMGTLVGKETGGVEIFFDEPIVLTLPNTGLRFLASHQYRWCACGKSTSRGIVPDYETTWNIKDKIIGVDTEIELIKELINKRGHTKSKGH